MAQFLLILPSITLLEIISESFLASDWTIISPDDSILFKVHDCQMCKIMESDYSNR